MARVSKVAVHTSPAKKTPPPPITVAAVANATNVTTTNAVLSATATDIHGTSKIKYTWSVISAPAGTPAPTFTTNASHAAQTTSVNFRMAGTYQFNVTATDPKGLKASNTVGVVVSSTINTIVVNSPSSLVASGGGLSFAAWGLDQFGRPAALPPVAWSATAGTITPAGYYTAPWSSGPVLVTAASGGVSRSTTIQVVSQPPTILSTIVSAGPASACLNLSIVAVGDGGPTNLTYSWAVLAAPPGAPAPIFSANGSNQASTIIASFGMAGSYTLSVTATDLGGLSTTRNLGVTVSPVLTSITVSPSTSALKSDQTEQFTADAKDQFGHDMAPQPAFTWSASAGSITPTGLFTAPQAGGSVTITTAAGSISGTASVSVTNPGPTIVSPASVSYQDDAWGYAYLYVDASDPLGSSSLAYTWTTTTSPVGAAAPTFSNLSSNVNYTGATVYAAGQYTFLVTVTDAASLSATSWVNVSIAQVATQVAITPSTLSLNEGAAHQFGAVLEDQFGAAMLTQPTFTWSASAGTITQAGLYTAPQAGGSATITAATDTLSATANVSIAGPTIVQPACVTYQNDAARYAYLYVTASDTASSSSPTYTWTTTAAPAGAAAPTFSNVTSIGNYTRATFHAAGQYTFQVTVTDAAGLSATSSVKATVAQVASQIAVTPGTVNLTQGTTQQFSAKLEDQFGAAMPSQPTFTWSASTGTISQAGLFTAPQTSGSVTITAAAGTISGTASVSLPGPAIVAPAYITYQNGAAGYAYLYVIASDPAGSSNLAYTWTTTAAPAGAAAPTFSNLNTDGSWTQANFHAPGQYTFLVTVTDAAGLSTTSSVNVSVAQVLQIAVTPRSVDMTVVGTQQFSAVLQDQFGTAVPSQPVFTWSASAGTITSSGLYTSLGVSGWVTITATAGTLSGTATVDITDDPWIVNPASASPSVVTGTSTTLSVLGDQLSGQDGGTGNLDYYWGVDAMPHDAPFPSFSVNNSNSAATTRVTVYQAGTYRFVVTVMGDVSGTWLSTPSYVTVTVNQTLTSVKVSPGPFGLAAGQSQALAATGFDQFGRAMATQPSFTWSTTAGTVSSSGLFTAPNNGGIATVTASAGSVSGQTNVYPTSALPTVASQAAAGSSTVTGTSTTLSVLGADPAGASGLLYTWATTAPRRGWRRRRSH
jgi:hypothetical protein